MSKLNKISERSFYGKVLLFGEYSIIQGGKALMIPFPAFSGSLDFVHSQHSAGNNAEVKSNQSLQKFHHYLKIHQDHSLMVFPLDTDRLREDVNNGLFFRSDIPQGYGLGSSGALVAAIISEYNHEISDMRGSGMEMSQSIASNLKAQLAFMESFFHGSSSGLDPMGSLLGRPFVYSVDDGFSYPARPIMGSVMQKQVFLVDTGQTRDTLSLVSWFKEQVEERNINADILKEINNEIIEAVVKKNNSRFDDFLAQLSIFQKDILHPMIPPHVHEIWDEGIQCKQWTLKLCGSGGGGYMLGFTSHWHAVEEIFAENGFKVIPVTV